MFNGNKRGEKRKPQTHEWQVIISLVRQTVVWCKDAIKHDMNNFKPSNENDSQIVCELFVLHHSMNHS